MTTLLAGVQPACRAATVKGRYAMKCRQWRSVCIGTAALLALVGCSSSTASGGPSVDTIKVGVLEDVTGAFALGHTAENGVKARFALQNAEGGVGGKKLAYVTADTTSTVPGTLSAAQTLVQNDHVFGIIGTDLGISGAVNFLKAKSVPLVGWYPTSANYGDPSFTNMFSASGSGNPKYLATTTYGNFFKSQGVTSVAGVSYSTAAGTAGVKATLKGAEIVGLKVAYQNTNLAVGTTDVGALALSIKESGADGIYLPLLANTSLALLNQLKEDGVTLKAAVMVVGYGQDTLGQAPAVAALQGIDFETVPPPVEANTQATQQMVAALSKYAGQTGEPYGADIQGWLMADLFIKGLEAAGSNPTPARFISELRKVNNYDAGGLYTKPIDFNAVGNLGVGVGPGNCIYVTKLVGNAFQVIPSANPVCGESTGQTVG